MILDASSTIAEVASAVAEALNRADITAVLTGGACAALHSDGAYMSHDLDFIIRAGGTKRSLEEAMASLGFQRERDRYVHPVVRFFVEFPRGPLAIGSDENITPVQLTLDSGPVLALSATDSCRDRLAAFYHWSDRQSLDVAVDIAVRRPVDMKTMKVWSQREGATAEFEEFMAEVAKARRKRR